MAKFVPREKLSKRARKQLDSQKRTTWAFSPTTRKVESKKQYDRKKHPRAWTNGDGDAFFISRKPSWNLFCMPKETVKQGRLVMMSVP